MPSVGLTNDLWDFRKLKHGPYRSNRKHARPK
jgi:hypothetical protein